jgi:hypothetical protein
MTRKFYSAILAGSAVLTLGLGATAANATVGSGTAQANIVSAIQIFEDAGLNFGTIVPAASGATVVINTTNGKSCGAGLTCSGASVSGALHATGTANQAVTIATAASTSLSDGGTNTMSVTGIAPSISSGNLGASSRIDFTVGATLNVGASQAAGVYTGNYSVTVNYN